MNAPIPNNNGKPALSIVGGFVRTEKPTVDGWGIPESLLDIGSESARYPLNVLPGVVGAAVREVVEIVKCPPALAANSALSVLAVAGQGIANVQPNIRIKPSPLSLYLLSIGESGERKTTADDFFSGVLDMWAHQKQQEIEPDLIKGRADVVAWKAEIEGIKDSIKQAARKGQDNRENRERLAFAEATQPKPIYAPNMVSEDTTPQSVAFDLVHEWPSVGILSSEAGVVFGGHGMKADNITGNLATLNKLWEGGTLSVKRRGEGGSFNVRDVRLSMGLAIQPSIIRDFYEINGEKARGSGFAARFLLAFPASTKGNRIETIEEISQQHPKKALNLFYAKLHEVLEQQYANAKNGKLENLPILKLSSDAKDVWLEYLNSAEIELRAGGDMADYSDLASKTANNAARIAGLFHLFNGGDVLDTISGNTMEAATMLAGWHLYEARRFFSEIAVPTDISNAIKLDAWIIDYCRTHYTDNISRRDLQRLAPNKVRNGINLDKALDELADANRVQVRTEGRKSIIDINPALLGG
ncbi:MAG: YfjI family protein [Thiothrix sp.]|uniref:YfjI family protein n=1 Tax=Thiothrix sp. TaxID=1032 RepID=UPI00261561AC|nr:YfjI family protein [Thiothrix sp.]MDD5394432.1 YfjI family protein [Thiothrix sp.]